MGETGTCSFCDFPAPHIPFINDEGDSLQFVIFVKNEEEKKKLVKLIQDRKGCAYTTLDKVNGNSAVFVDEDATSTLDFNGDVFKVSYIEECTKKCKILDISPFLKQPSTKFVDGFDYMRIFYTREYTWDSVPLEHQVKITNQIQNSLTKKKDQHVKEVNNTETELPRKNLFITLKPLESLIAKTKQISVDRSLKRNKEDGNESLSGPSKLGKTTTVSSVPSKVENDVENVQSSSPTSSRKLEKSESDNESDDSFKSSSVRSTIADGPKFGSDKRTRAAYSIAEKEAILKYIVKYNLYDYLKGVAVWKEMERNDVCPIRTWQSMKEHTIKTLTKELNRFKFLTPDERHRIKFCFSKNL